MKAREYVLYINKLYIYINIYIYTLKQIYKYIYKYNIHIYRQPKFNIDAQNDGI